MLLNFGDPKQKLIKSVIVPIGNIGLFMKISAIEQLIEVFRRLIFSLVIGNYDAHAKNFSVSSDDAISLSPAYNLVCTALYEDLDTTFAMLIGKANDFESLDEEALRQLFDTIQKKYNTIRKQLIKYADLSLNAVSDVVTGFKEGDYYQIDLDSAERILEIVKANHETVIRVLEYK